MAIVPITKTQVVEFDRESALHIDVENLYVSFEKRTGTPDIRLTVQGGQWVKEQWLGGDTKNVTRRPGLTLGSFIGAEYEELRVTARWTLGGLDPKQTMTRGEFVMELLDMWDQLYAGMKRLNGSRPSADESALVAAMEVLKSTYNFGELGTPIETINTYLIPDYRIKEGQ